MSHYSSNLMLFMWLTNRLLTLKNIKFTMSIQRRMINKSTKLNSKLTQSPKHMLLKSSTSLEQPSQKNLIWTLELTLHMAMSHCRISQMTKISNLLSHKPKSIIQTSPMESFNLLKFWDYVTEDSTIKFTLRMVYKLSNLSFTSKSHSRGLFSLKAKSSILEQIASRQFLKINC